MRCTEKKENTMTKFVFVDDGTASPEQFSAVREGCKLAQKKLGKLGERITLFHIGLGFLKGSKEPRFSIKIVYEDFMGKEGSFHTFSSLVYKKSSKAFDPSVVSRDLLKWLEGLIRRHLSKGQERLELARLEYELPKTT